MSILRTTYKRRPCQSTNDHSREWARLLGSSVGIVDVLMRGHRRADQQGRVRSETLDIDFGIAPEGGRLVLIDVATGEPLLRLAESEEAREAEKRAREAAELRASQEEAARRAAEAENRKLAREIERLRAKLTK